MKPAIVAAALVVLLVSPVARAEGSLTDAQLNAIRSNCSTVKINIQNLQDTDKRTRLNRGPRYEALLRLMANFNSRAAQMKVDAPELISIVSDYQKTLDSFRSEYTAYDDGLTNLVVFDCTSEPTTFYDKMVSLRTSRSKMNEYDKQLGAYLDAYKSVVEKVKTQLGDSR